MRKFIMSLQATDTVKFLLLEYHDLEKRRGIFWYRTLRGGGGQPFEKGTIASRCDEFQIKEDVLEQLIISMDPDAYRQYNEAISKRLMKKLDREIEREEKEEEIVIFFQENDWDIRMRVAEHELEEYEEEEF